MKNRYTYAYSLKVSGKITVTAKDDDEGQQLAIEMLENAEEFGEVDEAEAEIIDVKDVEPDGPDRIEE